MFNLEEDLSEVIRNKESPPILPCEPCILNVYLC